MPTDMSFVSHTDSVELLTIAASLTFAAFFSGCETAITSLGTLKAKQMLEQGKQRQKPLTLWLAHPGRVLTTILIFNNLFHILASAVATDFANRHLQNNAISIATGVMTLLILIFVEIVPKSFAKTHSERLAPPT
ncbi:MAG: CNNM domain-containing protein [Proteobacteria bacterium]|nr:CNNM domain-containing protein [Pseudomonadota bacterium]